MKPKSLAIQSLSELVRQSASQVVAKAKYVTISDDAINTFSLSRNPNQEHWLKAFPWINVISDTDSLLEILFAFNTISFCYWGVPKWSSSFSGESMDGSRLMLMCLRQAIHKNKRALKPLVLAKLHKNEFLDILKGATNLKLVDERFSMLRLLGEVVSDKYGGSYLQLIGESNGTAQGLLATLIRDLPSFNDVSKYEKNQVYFYKRAQLLVSDINYCLQKGRFRELQGIDTLTACADYKLPQMLRKFGILIYSDSLAHKVDSMYEIESNSNEETEIRCATVVAVERIVDTYQKQGNKTTAMNVNHDLWLMSQTLSTISAPYHRTVTTNY